MLPFGGLWYYGRDAVAKTLCASGRIVGANFPIYDPERDPELRYARPLVRCIADGVPGAREACYLTNEFEFGGVTTDALGNIYIADFGEIVWKFTPEGKRHEFTSGFYRASGNAIDKQGNLLQSNFYGDSIIKIDRKGQAKAFVTSSLSGPVGIAINKQTGDVHVANCRGNSISKGEHVCLVRLLRERRNACGPRRPPLASRNAHR